MRTAGTYSSSIILVAPSIGANCAAANLFALNMLVITHIALCGESSFSSGTVATITIARTAASGRVADLPPWEAI